MRARSSQSLFEGVIAIEAVILELINAIEAIGMATDDPAVHRLRVSVRRARTLAPLIADLVGPSFMTSEPVRLLRELGHNSNQLRDHQVRLALLGRFFSEGLPRELADWVAQQNVENRTHQLAFIEYCRHPATSFGMLPWRDVLATVESVLGDAPQALQTARRRRIRSLQRKVQLAASHPTRLLADPVAWHKTRLDCKRIRYLIETLPYHDTKPVRMLGKLAARAQDCLGALNDIDGLANALIKDQVIGETWSPILNKHREVAKLRAARAIKQLQRKA